MYLCNISLTYHELGEIESTNYYRKESLKYCTPNSYDYFVNMGDLDVLSGDIRSAINNFGNALNLDSEKLEVNNSIGLIYIGDYGEEYIDLEKGLKHNIKSNS
jgi:tetratricopeptide (TPR) repeat protein